MTGQIDSATGAISAATLSMPPITQPPTEGETPTFTFSEVNPGTATGTYNSTTGVVTLHDVLSLSFHIVGIIVNTCVSTPIDVALSGTYNSTTQDVTLSTTSSFTIPQFPVTSNCIGPAAAGINASPGGVAGSVGNSMSLALHGQFAPGLPTTTALTTSIPSPQLTGTPVTLTATVADPSTAGTPTGNVNFEANGTSVGTGNLSPSGTTGTATATLTTTTLPQSANPDQLTAVYGGDTNYAGSTSDSVPYTIQALPSITSTFPSQFTAGATTFPTPTPFTVTISNPVGGATYANNLFLFLSIGWNNSMASKKVQLSYEDQAGTWCPITSGSSGYGPSGSPLSDLYGPQYYFSGFGTPPCGFTSAFSLNPGSSLTINMEIAFSNDGATTKLLAGAISLATALETGSCSSTTACTATAPLTGATAVTSQAQSTIIPESGPGTLATTITDLGWPAAGTIRSGYDMQLSAEVTEGSGLNAGAPTGVVQFFLDGNLVQTAPLPATTGEKTAETGSVLYDPGVLPPGTHTETINYSGDLVFAPNSLTETFTVVAGPPTGTLYACSIVGDFGGSPWGPIDAYVTASGAGLPTTAFSGSSVSANDVSVTLDMDGVANPDIGSDSWNLSQANQLVGFSPGDVSVDAGSATFTSPTPATDIIGTFSGLSVTTDVTGNPGDVVPIGVASISFDYGLAGSVDCTPVSQAVTIGSVAIIGTTLSVSPSGSAPVGAPVTMTATVAPLPPAPNGSTTAAVAPGQVDFYDGSTYLATAAVSSTTGAATFTTSTLSTGDHQLTAIWSGYSGVPSNTSNTVDYTVGTATTTSLASSANPANAANPVTYTATVSPPLGALTQPTGDVSFTSDGNPVASCQSVALSMASPPTATCTTNFGAGQSHAIVATYTGDATYLGSASDTLTQTTLPGTNTTILSTKDPSPAGNVQFWSGVSPSSGKGATPTGTVAFSIDGSTYKPCSAQPLGPGGGASCTVSFKAGTSHKVFATYAGSSSYSGSKSNTITQTVTGAKASTTPKATAGSATLASGKSLTAGQSISTGSYKLVMQSDGNLVEYQGSKALWASGTSGHPGTGVVMQKDGNLVEYQGGTAIWASGTAGHAGAHLTLQGSDGNVVIYGPGGQALWATGT